MVCHSLLQWTTFCQLSPPWPTRLGLPHMAWLSFIELDKAVVLVWLEWLVFCEYGFSVSALWCLLATPIVLLGFLLPWAWGISSWLLQQSAAIAPYPGRGNAEEAVVEWFYEDLQDLLELTPKKDVLFITGDWNAKVGSQETPGVTGKFGLGIQNEAGQTLIEFC